MKIKRKNKLEIIELITILIIIIISIVLFNKIESQIFKISIVIVNIYLFVILINGFLMLKNCYIKIDDNILHVSFLKEIKNKSLSNILSPFIKKFKYYSIYSYEIELDDIVEFDFVKNINKKFDNAKKFDIGIIDKYKDKYIIIINQFRDEDIINLIEMIQKKLNLHK